MKTLKTLTLSLVLATAATNMEVSAQSNPQASTIPATPAKTIILKHPAANNATTFFATGTQFSFEVYKPGDIAQILVLLKSDAAVDNAAMGTLTGDYQQVNLVLKTAKDKIWFANLFKKAGLNTIKINNNPVTDVNKI